VPTPPAKLVRSQRDLVELGALTMPVIVKPNFEGSSKGITQTSVVTDAAILTEVVTERLARYPAGVLVEQYVDGIDVAVGWVDGLGVLPPIGYAYEPTGEHHIYDLALKQGPPEHIDVQVPAPLDAVTTQRVRVLASRAFEALGIAGYGRVDFRVTPDGAVYFLEMNPLPTLDPRERDLYAAAAAIGKTPREVFAAIIDAAVPQRQLPARCS
jgi:D-alanine-D-alanine ligase